MKQELTNLVTTKEAKLRLLWAIMYDETLTARQRRIVTRLSLEILSLTDMPELYPQKKIPNVKKFNVEIRPEYHPVFKRYGIKKRKYHPILNSEPYLNQSLNRYITHQFQRLNKTRTQTKTFWRISETLLNRSSSYASLTLYETFPGWHRNKSYPEVWEAVREMRQLDLRNYKHRITEIPKDDKGNTRALNIPSDGWRLYLHGLNRILQVWLSPYTHPSQHGFIPGRGTTTAWRQIHDEVLESPNIYEFDLKKYFDSVNLDYLKTTLKSMQLPSLLIDRIIKWSRTAPENSTHSLQRWNSPYEEASDYKYHITGTYDIWSEEEHIIWIEKKRKSEEMHPYLRRYDYYRGVAQGSPISPLISTLLITRLLLLNPHCRVVQYADDGILYNLTCSPQEILHFPPESGISVNWTKSRWLRRDGEWLAPLKFLGAEYRYVTEGAENQKHIRQHGTLNNATRTPKELQVDIYHVLEDAWAHDKGKKVSPGTGKSSESFEEWFKTKYHGFLMSRIYQGKLDITDVQQNFTYHYKSRSWAELNNLGINFTSPEILDGEGREIHVNVFNSSSFAHHAIAQRITKTLRPKSLTNFRY